MLFLSTLLLTAVGAYASVEDVTNSIKTIGTSLSQLNADVKSFHGGPSGFPYALQVQLDAVQLYRSIGNTEAAAKASSPFGDQGSNNVSTALLNISQPIKDTLSNVQSKAGVFAELGPIVLASLRQLKNSTDDLGAQVVDKLSEPFKSAAPTVLKDIDSEFDSAISAYVSQEGRSQA